MEKMLFILAVCASGLFGPAMIRAQETVFTPEQLATYDGKDGHKAYYAYEGVVYDVTTSTLWKIGEHFGHTAGKDLTGKLEGAPHGDDIVKAMPVVGRMSASVPPAGTTSTPAPDPKTEISPAPWYTQRIRFVGISLLGWTGILLGIVFVLNFFTCFALPWSKLPVPWHGSRIGPDSLDAAPARKNFASIHKYFAWATVILGIVHAILGFFQVFFQIYV